MSRGPFDFGALLRPLRNFVSSIVEPPDRHHRRLWVHGGRAHIEVRGLGAENVATAATDTNAERRETLSARLKQVLEAVDGVNWAEVNAVTGRVAVAFDDGALDVDDLVDVVSEVEDAQELTEERFPAHRPEHPGDREPLQRAVTAGVADVVGLAVSIFGRVLQTAPIPTEVASIVTLIDSTPRARRLLEDRVGRPVADVGLAVTNAAAQALAQGPAGLVLDLGYRVSQVTEIESRRAAWERREPELANGDHDVIHSMPIGARPRPLPAGSIERYTDRASLLSLSAFGATWAISGSIRTAANALLAGMPKAARMGREAFAAQATRVLADRGVVVLDPGVMRRLDRIDTVVIDAEVLTTGRFELGQVEAMGPVSHSEARAHAHALFAPDRPDAVQRRGRWALGPLQLLDATMPRGAHSRARSLTAAGGRTLGLARDGAVVALAVAQAELDRHATALVDSVVGGGLMLVVAGTAGGVARRVGAARRVATGRRLTSAVRALQAERRGVAVVSRNSAALRASDCGVGLLGGPDAPPWGADLLLGPGLETACLVVEAVPIARRTSQNSALLALAGSAVGAVGAVVGPPGLAAPRALLAVNGAAMLSLAAGSWAGAGLSRHRVHASAPSVPWHELEPADALARLGTSVLGLGDQDAERRRRTAARDDPAAHEEPPNLGEAVVQELATPLTPILGVGAALSAAVGSLADSLLVGGVVVANAVISGAQRVRTEQALRRLIETTAVKVRVRRRGEVVELAPEALVPGDIVLLGPGELVPADCRILEAASLEVDESSLSGESLPVAKHARPCPGAAVADRACMLYQGATVVAGTAEALAVAVGAETEAARALLGVAAPPPTGVEHRLQRLTTVTVPVSIGSGAAVVAASLLRGQPAQAGIGSGVGLMVASVPEGLPLLASVAQLASARRLAERHVLVRNPASVEALGRVDTLCFDKTGTLTEGRIALQQVSDGRRDEAPPELSDAGRWVLRVALRASPRGDDSEPVAHATDEAVVKGGAAAGVGADDADRRWIALAELPFETERGFHAVFGELQGGSRPRLRLLAVKGAPEVVLARCRRWAGAPTGPRAGSERPDGDDTPERGPLDAATRAALDRQIERMARRGLRVLAVAQRAVTTPEPGASLRDEQVDELDFVGFLGLADAARPKAAAAVAGLRRAGVDVAMITGDHPSTAEAIAAELGILNGRRVMTGAQLDALDDASLGEVLPGVSVFARVAPAHKVRIVEGLQRAGRVVAMTGDGANDAAAIRLAHTGIALGQRGAAPARAAADLVVTDDRIETLVDAIVEGRAMWSSVRDALAILLGGNLGEVAFTVAATALTGQSPLNARQLLVVNLLTDLFPAMAIAVRPPRGMSPEALLHEGPEASLGQSLVRDVVERGVTTAMGAGLAWTLARATGSPERASTVGLVALVGTQLGQTLLSGSASPLVVGSSLASAVGLVAIVQTPGVSQLFGCTPLDPLAWATALGSATAATLATAALGARSRLRSVDRRPALTTTS